MNASLKPKGHFPECELSKAFLCFFSGELNTSKI